MATEVSTTQTASLVKNLIGKLVIVKIKDEIEYHGKLLGLDGFMNTYLDDAEEYLADGQKGTVMGEAFVRGTTGLTFLFLSNLHHPQFHSSS